MKPIIYTLLAVFILPCLAASANRNSEREKIAFYFAGREPKAGIHAPLSDLITEAIVNGRKYTAVDRTTDALAILAQEHQYQRSGAVDDNQMAALGKQLGVDYVIAIRIVSSLDPNMYYLEARMIGVEYACIAQMAAVTSNLNSIIELKDVAARIVRQMEIGASGRRNAARNRCPPRTVSAPPPQQSRVASSAPAPTDTSVSPATPVSKATQQNRSASSLPAPVPSAPVSSAPSVTTVPRTTQPVVAVSEPPRTAPPPQPALDMHTVTRPVFEEEDVDPELAALLSSVVGSQTAARRTDAVIHSGGRSAVSIQNIVMRNMILLMQQYSNRLRARPDLTGIITIRFAINEFGMVTSAQMSDSTVRDAELERRTLDFVRRLDFERIDIHNDITEVAYTFTFEP